MVLKNKKAFTLAELMVCLLLISVLATILLPAIIQNKPNKNKVLFRKAYYIIERVVSELINDEDIYPNDEENGLMGFANYAEVTYAGETVSGASKFCELFYQKLNTTTTTPRCNSNGEIWSAVPSDSDAEGSFMTNDGIIWYMPSTNVFASTNYAGVPEGSVDGDGNPIPASPGGAVEQNIFLDVNGVMPPNCVYNAGDPSLCPSPDRFSVLVRFDGKIRVEGEKEQEYLMSNSTLK